jgi:hypothetical protein
MTKEQLIKLLQEDKSPIDTPVCVYLNCENDDKGIVGNILTELEYSKNFECIMIYGTYEEDEY